MIDEAAARREIRRRKILEGGNSRLSKITGREHNEPNLVVDPVELYPDPDFERDTYEAPPPNSPNANVFELLRTMNAEQSSPSEPRSVIPETLLSRLVQRKVPIVLLAVIVYFMFATSNEFLLGSNVFVALMGWEVIEFFLNGRSFRPAGGSGSYLNILFMLGGIPPQTTQLVLIAMELANKVLRDVAVFIFFFVITHILWSYLFMGEILSQILDKDFTSHVEL